MHTLNEWLSRDPQALFVQPSDSPFGDLAGEFLAEMARLIHAADPAEIVGVSSTSAGLNAVAQAIRWKRGDNLIFVDGEFPSNVYPWLALKRRGVQARLAAPDLGGLSVEAVARLADAHTRLVAVSAMQFFTGHRADLAALGAFCRERGILLAVDAIQAAGHLPIDVQAMQIDILSAGGQKSLMGPPGQGFLYVRGDVCEALRPASVGPNATRDYLHWLRYDLTPYPGAQRFLMGTMNLAGMVGLLESVRFLRGLGLANIAAWTQHLSQIAIQDLTARGYEVIAPSDPAHLGPIVTFRAGTRRSKARADAQVVGMVSRLAAQNIRVVKHWNKENWPHIRISCHCYNTEEEMLRVGSVLEGYKP
jgi:selenocysteine lyase/cysteine desulfurase